MLDKRKFMKDSFIMNSENFDRMNNAVRFYEFPLISPQYIKLRSCGSMK